MEEHPSPLKAIILAAGKGTRMRSSLPKVLHPVMGKPLVLHAVDHTFAVTGTKPVVVVGNGADEVRQAVGSRADFAVQACQLGTADAVKAARPAFLNFEGMVLIVYADMPLLTQATLQTLVDTQRANAGVLSMLSVEMPDPHGFGRVVRDADGNVSAIVEEAQADASTLAIRELNTGVYCVRSDWLWSALDQIQVSPKGEFYLTDLVAISVKEHLPVKCLKMADYHEAIGINTRVHLAEAEQIMRQRINQRWMTAGVTMIDPAHTYIDAEVTLEQDVILYPDTHLYGKTVIKTGSQIGPCACLYDTVAGANCRLGPQVIVRQAVVSDGEQWMGVRLDGEKIYELKER